MKRIIYIISSILPLIAWIYALLERFTQKDWLMLIIDVVIAPIGVIDGIGLYFGFW